MINGPQHRLERHTSCSSYFCEGPKIGELDMVPEAERCGILQEINKIMFHLVNTSSSLIVYVDNNVCEQFNSIINKYIDGKIINFSQSNNYFTRVRASIIEFNSKKYLRTIHKKIMNKNPGN